MLMLVLALVLALVVRMRVHKRRCGQRVLLPRCHRLQIRYGRRPETRPGRREQHAPRTPAGRARQQGACPIRCACLRAAVRLAPSPQRVSDSHARM